MSEIRPITPEEIAALRLIARRATVFISGLTDSDEAYNSFIEAVEAWWGVKE